MEDPADLLNLKDPHFLTEVILRAPFWTLTDLWPKGHVYFVRHLCLCDIAKKTLVRKRLLRIGRYFVQKAWIDYQIPMSWNEKIRVKIFVAGLLKKGKIPLLKYELHSSVRDVLLAEAHLLYHPPLQRKKIETLFFDNTLKEALLLRLTETGTSATIKR
jgi:acyl-CoA thioesterase FadM